ncbi:Small GTPase superfamily [Penicillium expansum]|uniref:Small GTPase superfamily n=1 Tax=Penicillium expansum TaxID=27334 RepID=A0A0A2JK69_PENEN|nr:Small GTPase superfamily [Penicillium expansum]KGO39285.1 Small GTPase superfamily [Penicillium expansum]KGO55201.1 Small GTPase superfamily [Penicillium expansum]
MDFFKRNSGPLVAPEVEAPAVPVVAESEQIAPEDQTQQAQEQAYGQGEEIPPEQPLEQSLEQPLDQPLEQSAPVMVNIEEPASDHTISRAAINNGYNSDSKAHYHSRSTDFHQSAPEYAAQDTDQSRQNSSPLLNHHPLPVPNSRPGSGLSSGPERAPGVSQLQQQDSSQRQASQANKNSVVIKVGMVGDAQIGKTSLMVKYVEGSWDEDYIQTLGVNFMEKTISIRNTEITFSIWDLGGQREFVNMLPLVCNDAVAILFMFDLTRKSTLNSIKEWYRQGRGFNKTAIPFLVGTKYDHFVNFPREDQEEISIQAKRFAKAMKASLIFSSTSHSINVQKIFKIVLAKAFDLKCTIPEIENVGEPLLLYKNV